MTAPSLRRLATLLLLPALLLTTRPAAGVPADVRLPGLRGGQLTSADLSRGALVLVVWASWSPRCRDIAERANAISDRFGDRARVVTIDFQEDPREVDAFLAGKNLRVEVFLDRDGEFSKAYGIATLPGLIVLRDGEVRYQGKLPADAEATISDALR